MAPPQPNVEFELSDFNFNDSQFDEWNKGFIAHAHAEAVEEATQWGAEQLFHGDPDQAVILASFNVHTSGD
jgi:hypothetical protein